MNELLEYGRGEFEPSTWFMDEETSQAINVSAEVAKPAFERFMQLRSFVEQQQTEIKQRFLLIAVALLEIEREKLYFYVTPKDKVQGFSNFYDFANKVFGLKKTTAATLVKIAREYCTEEGTVKLPYMRYSYSQLAEMLPMQEERRLRVPASMPVRKIRCLTKFYANNNPRDTVEEDLAEYERQVEEEKKKKVEQRNAIQFIPASAPSEEVQTSEPLDADGDDERDVATVARNRPSYEAVREGLYMQLRLLRKCWEGQGKGMYAVWDAFCTHIETALRARFPDYIKPYNEVFRPEEPEIITFEYLRDVINNDFDRLKELDPSWLHLAKLVSDALESKDYMYLTMRSRLTEARKEIAKIAIENQSLRNQLADNKQACETLKGEVESKLPLQTTKGKAASGKLSLKNKKERQEWLENFKAWGVWLSVPDVAKTFYRYDFENGCSLIVEESVEFSFAYYDRKEGVGRTFLRYAIIDALHPKYDSAYQGGASGIVDWLSKHQKEI